MYITHDGGTIHANTDIIHGHSLRNYLAPRGGGGGGCEVLFSPCLSVCVCLCLSVCLCVRPIFWYFISQLLEEISI